jgi:hypothetical protein
MPNDLAVAGPTSLETENASALSSGVSEEIVTNPQRRALLPDMGAFFVSPFIGVEAIALL